MSETAFPPCPQCGSAFTYEDGSQLVCPECGHEWTPNEASSESDSIEVRDAVGNLLADGHNIDCKIDGFGAMRLKSEFVKKA